MQTGAFAILPNHQAYPEHLDKNNTSGKLYQFPKEFKNVLKEASLTVKKGKMKSDFEVNYIIKEWDAIISKTIK